MVGFVTFGVVGSLGFLPWFLWGDVGPNGVFEGLRTFGERWQYSPGYFRSD